MPDMFPHQLTGSLRLSQGVPTYLAFDMGIGKTRTFIEAVKLRGAMRVLVICPATALLVWKREIALWHPEATFIIIRTHADFVRSATYYLVSHGLLSQRNGPVAETLALGGDFDMTAIDEAHAFNAADTIRVKALRRASPKLGDITPLSGTPMRNHAGDLYTLLLICWPQGLCLPSGRPMNRYDFEERFCKVAHRSFGGNRMVRIIEGSKNLEYLKALIFPFMLRVRKEDVFKDMPPILWDTVPIPLDPAHLPEADLKRLEAAFERSSATGTPEEDLTEVMRRAGADTSLMTLRRMLGLAKLRGATDYIIDMLDSLHANRKVLVFAHHSDVVTVLERHLGEYSPAVIVGGTSPRDREAAVDKFLNDPRCRVFIGNIQAAGTAITLVGPKCKCSDVVFVESSWTPMDNAQAACRVHRIGQQDGVVARMLYAEGTVDDLISSLLARKAREFTQLFDATPEGEEK